MLIDAILDLRANSRILLRMLETNEKMITTRLTQKVSFFVYKDSI